MELVWVWLPLFEASLRVLTDEFKNLSGVLGAWIVMGPNLHGL